MNEKQISECMYISQISAFHSPALLHQPDEQRFVIFVSYWIVLSLLLQERLLSQCTDMMHSECMLGVLTSKLALGSCKRADVVLFVCLTSSINELMCVQLLVKLSLDCVYSEMEGSDTAVQTGNPVISSRCPRRPKKQVRCDVA